MPDRIRHLAIVSKQPEEMADYYVEHLFLEDLDHTPAGDVAVTDGYFNLAFLTPRQELGDELGPNHMGIQVEDVEGLKSRLAKYAPNVTLEPAQGGGYGEYQLVDPNGMLVRVSSSSFGVATERREFPGIRHVAMRVNDPDAGVDFYVKVFGFREVSSSRKNRQQGSPARFVGDGFTSLAILPDRALSASLAPDRQVQGGHPKDGLNHFGFLVPDKDQALAGLPQELRGGKRPADRPMAEHRASDPEGNVFDISQQTGFEVDDNVWERVPDTAATAH